MERDNINEYNLIFDGDNARVIGFLEEIKRYYKNIAKDYIRIGIYNEVRDILDLLDEIDLGKFKDNDLVEVVYMELDYCYKCKLIKSGEEWY